MTQDSSLCQIPDDLRLIVKQIVRGGKIITFRRNQFPVISFFRNMEQLRCLFTFSSAFTNSASLMPLSSLASFPSALCHSNEHSASFANISPMVRPPLPYCLAMVMTTLFIPITIPFCLCCFHPQRLKSRVIHPDMLS